MLVVLFVDAATDYVIANQKNDGKNHTDNQACGGLHEHGNMSHAGDAELINPHQIFRRDKFFILSVVVITLCLKGNQAVLVNNLYASMGQYRGAGGVRIEEGNNIAFLDFFRLCCLDDYKIARHNGILHGGRENDQRRITAEGRNLVGVNISLNNHRNIHNQNGNKNHTKHDSQHGKYLVPCGGFFLDFCFFTHDTKIPFLTKYPKTT